MKHKVVVHGTWGGFNLSDKAVAMIQEIAPECVENISSKRDGVWLVYRGPRHHPALVQVVETLGAEAGDDLEVVEIEGNRYWIEEYDGCETVHTPYNQKWTVIE